MTEYPGLTQEILPADRLRQVAAGYFEDPSVVRGYRGSGDYVEEVGVAIPSATTDGQSGPRSTFTSATLQRLTSPDRSIEYRYIAPEVVGHGDRVVTAWGDRRKPYAFYEGGEGTLMNSGRQMTPGIDDNDIGDIADTLAGAQAYNTGKRQIVGGRLIRRGLPGLVTKLGMRLTGSARKP